MNLLRRIAKWLEDNQIFQREKNNEQRALGMILYNAGLSYKKSRIVYKRKLRSCP
jgi:hypothetical protein